jgi:hypothetical protein
MSLKTLLVSTLLAASAIATDYGSGGGGFNSWGGGGMPPSGEGPPAVGAASCPAGCWPMPTCSAPPPMQTQPGQLIVQVVSVADANGSLKYFPNKITAAPGTIVQFQFHPKVCAIFE